MNYSREEKARLLEGWKASGKSISAYVREKGLVRWTFTRWIKYDRETNGSLEDTPFVEVAAPDRAGEEEILIEKGAVKIHIPLCVGCEKLRAIIVAAGAAV